MNDGPGHGNTGALHEAVRTLRSPATIRQRCASITQAVSDGQSTHFRIDRSRLPALAERVASITRERYPTLQIPYHSRWRHFEAGGVDRKAQLDARLLERSTTAAARSRIDLTLVSVLLDAGAGAGWRYVEPGSAQHHNRSEGLAVATFDAFMQGRFSSDPGDPFRVDAAALLRVDSRSLAEIFQVSADNPLVGLDGRAALLRRLGEALRARPDLFTSIGQPGHLFDALTHHAHAPRLLHHRPAPATLRHHHIKASRILGGLLDAFSGIWPSGQSLGDTPLGDVWQHRHAGGQGASAGWVPFHKLSQWLSYSLLEPFEWAGVQVTDLDELTALPEYRNGGLLIDGGVLVPCDESFASRSYKPFDEWIVEWRALTVVLLDEMAPLVRDALDRPDLPLACILEGGTWAAGRALAAERRGGAPPVTVDSDGTVF